MITRKGWYREIIDARFEIIKNLIHRETFFLRFDPEGLKRYQPVRWLNASFLAMLDRHFTQFKFIEEPMNLYGSLATYKNFPTFSYNLSVKIREQQIWAEQFHNYISAYDFFFETDAEDIAKSWGDAQRVKAFFDEMGVRYHLKFSGKKGFHLIIAHADFTHIPLPLFLTGSEAHSGGSFRELMQALPLKWVKGKLKNAHPAMDLVFLFKALAVRLATCLGVTDTADISVQDIKRVCKTPYSWDVKSGLICYPLSDEQFSHFDTSLCSPESVLKAKLHKRGLLWRNDDKTLADRQQAVNRMLREMGIMEGQS